MLFQIIFCSITTMNKVELERTWLEAVAGAGLGELERGSYLDMSEEEWEFRKLQSRVEGEGVIR